MSERDDKLEQKIQSLEEGEPVEHLIEGGDNSDELSSLINLAASIRDLPHPELDRQAVQSEKLKIISATRERNRRNQRQQGSKVGGFTGQWLFVPAAAGLALILLMVFVLSAGAGIYIAGPRGAHTATLTDAKGTLQVSDSGVSGDWHAVSNGDRVRAGQRVRTAADSWVTIEFFDGTQTTLAPNTDLMLENIDGQWGNVLQVELIQNAGQTEHGVVPLRGKDAAFNVYTPSGTASVKGTNFKVLVDESGKSTFKVEHGKVLVTNDGSQAYVRAGQGLATILGEPLSTPGYLFVVQGELTSKVEGMWTVAGVNIIVPEEAQVVGNPELYENVLVQGQIQDQYDWVADSIQPALADVQAGAYSGYVTAVSDDQVTWQVNGIDFMIDGEAQVDGGIEIGDAVRVAFVVLEGGGWQVVRIDSLEGEEDESQDDKDPDVDSPTDEDVLPSDEIVSCTGADPHPKAEKLAEKLLVDYPDVKVTDESDSVRSVTDADIIMGWFCNYKLGFGEIALAFKLSESSELSVDKIIKLRLGGQGWGQIKQLLADLTDDDAPDDEEEVPEDEGEIDDGEEETSDDDGDTCTGVDPHPKALKLEKEFLELGGLKDLEEVVDYGRIMDWFCDFHFGFGEIDQMVNLSARYGLAVDEVFDMRHKVGLGWGQIKQQLAANDPNNEEYKNPAGKVPPGKIKSE
ncbi:MAG: FecR domain-containing protein, partial [Anaerolineales bacterium]